MELDLQSYAQILQNQICILGIKPNILNKIYQTKSTKPNL